MLVKRRAKVGTLFCACGVRVPVGGLYWTAVNGSVKTVRQCAVCVNGSNPNPDLADYLDPGREWRDKEW